MTNGEKLKEVFPNMRIDVLKVMRKNYRFNNAYLLKWWNSEYKEPTTKNDLEVDAVSRKAVLNTLDSMDSALDEDRTVETYKDLLKECYKVLPSVTPQEPKSEWEQDHAILKAYSDGVNEVLDKIKENIQFIKDQCLPNSIAEEYEQKGLQEALDIIDKYKAESEIENGNDD